MIQKFEKPEIFNTLQERFGVSWNSVVITYYPYVYAKYHLTPDLIVHEQTHLDQQKEIGVEKWWEMYLENKNFRLLQEIEAYKNQITWIQKNIKDRNNRFRLVDGLLKDLSSSMYGNIITYPEARKLLNIRV